MDKMKIFITWSGPRSGVVAEALKEYLPMINNAFDPWLSSEDIPKGSRSTTEIAEALANATAGIICLTPNNLTAPWILWEAGAIAKTVKEKPLACTLLIGLEPSQVERPLGDHQHTRLTEKELLRLVKDLNKASGAAALSDAQIEKAFKLCWPELKDRLDKLPPDGPSQRPRRSELDLLDELLDLARRQTDVQDYVQRDTTERLANIRTELEMRIQELSMQFQVELAKLRKTFEFERHRANSSPEQPGGPSVRPEILQAIANFFASPEGKEIAKRSLESKKAAEDGKKATPQKQ
jgi:hypothetical protein